jgi:hypothetical protein
VGADKSREVLASEDVWRAGADGGAGEGAVRSNEVLAAAAAGGGGTAAAGRDGTGCGANRSSDESPAAGGAAGIGRCDGAGRGGAEGGREVAGGGVVAGGGGGVADREACALARPATKSAMAELV